MSAGELLQEEDEENALDAMPLLYRPLMWALCMALVFFQIYTAGFGQFPPLSQRAVHVGLGLAIVFLGFVRFYGNMGSRKNLWQASDMVFAALSIVATIYILTQETRITESFNLAVMPIDLILGSILTIILLVAAWRTTGLTSCVALRTTARAVG